MTKDRIVTSGINSSAYLKDILSIFAGTYYTPKSVERIINKDRINTIIANPPYDIHNN